MLNPSISSESMSYALVTIESSLMRVYNVCESLNWIYRYRLSRVILVVLDMRRII